MSNLNLPDGWKQCKIEEIANIYVGRDLKEESYSKTKTEKHTFPVYSNSVDNYGLYGYYDFEEYPSNCLTVVGRGVGLGTAFPRDKGFGAIGRLLVVSPKEKAFNARYLSEYINTRLTIYNESSGIPQLPGASFAKYKVILPTYDEQVFIADLLEQWDTAIEKTEALIDAKERQFGWLVTRLLSSPKNIENHQKITLGEIGDISSAGVDKKIVEDEEDVVLLNYLDVYRRNKIFASEVEYRVTAPKSKVEKCSIKKGDIFFTPSSEVQIDIGHSAVAMEDVNQGVYSYHIVRLRPKIELDLLYSAYAFKSHGFYKQASKYADGSGQRYVISQSNLRKIEVFLPPLKEQKRIAEVLDTAQQEITLLKKLVDQYRTQKRGLMQKLLSGNYKL